MSIDSYRKLDLQPGIQLHVWNVRVHALKELTASLLVIRDGNPQTASKFEYKWEKWDSSQPPASGQILLLMQDGQVFGVKDKRVPLLTVDFPDLREGTRVASTSISPIDGDVKGNISTATNAGSPISFPPGQTHKAILYGELFVPPKDLADASLSPDLDVLIKAARPGRAVVAIILEWVPR